MPRDEINMVRGQDILDKTPIHLTQLGYTPDTSHMHLWIHPKYTPDTPLEDSSFEPG